MNTLATARNAALVLLIAEAFAIGFVPLALGYLAVRGMQRLLPRLRGWLEVGRDWALKATRYITLFMRWLLAPVLFLSGLKEGVLAGLAALAGHRRRRRAATDATEAERGAR